MTDPIEIARLFLFVREAGQNQGQRVNDYRLRARSRRAPSLLQAMHLRDGLRWSFGVNQTVFSAVYSCP
jgi:hypothetical protein